MLTGQFCRQRIIPCDWEKHMHQLHPTEALTYTAVMHVLHGTTQGSQHQRVSFNISYCWQTKTQHMTAKFLNLCSTLLSCLYVLDMPLYFCCPIQDREDGHNLRSATTTLCQPFTTKTFAKRAYQWSAPAVWKSLLKTVVNTVSVIVFKSRLQHSSLYDLMALHTYTLIIIIIIIFKWRLWKSKHCPTKLQAYVPNTNTVGWQELYVFIYSSLPEIWVHSINTLMLRKGKQISKHKNSQKFWQWTV